MYRCLRSICINLYQYVSTFDVNFLPNVRQCWMFTMTLRALAALYKRRQFHRRDSLKSNWHNFLHQNCVSVRRDDRNSKCLTDFILLVPPNPKKNSPRNPRNFTEKFQMTDWSLLLPPRSPLQDPKKNKNSDINYDLASIKHLYIFAWMVEKASLQVLTRCKICKVPRSFRKLGGTSKII